MSGIGEIETAKSCVEHLRAVLACLDRLASTEQSAADRESLAVAAIHVHQAIELVEPL